MEVSGQEWGTEFADQAIVHDSEMYVAGGSTSLHIFVTNFRHVRYARRGSFQSWSGRDPGEFFAAVLAPAGRLLRLLLRMLYNHGLRGV